MLSFCSVLFPFKQRSQTICTDRPFCPFIFELFWRTMASKPMQSCGLGFDTRVKGWLWRGFVASVPHSGKRCTAGLRDNAFQLCERMGYKPQASLASQTTSSPPFLHTYVMTSVKLEQQQWRRGAEQYHLGRVQMSSLLRHHYFEYSAGTLTHCNVLFTTQSSRTPWLFIQCWIVLDRCIQGQVVSGSFYSVTNRSCTVRPFRLNGDVICTIEKVVPLCYCFIKTER